MAEEVERRLAAILAADVVGYSRLMGDDEAGTYARLKALRKDVIEPEIAKRHGRIVKLTGDGTLVEFSSAVDAVTCAVAAQNAIAERNADVPQAEQLWFRVGINIGDVIFDDNDIYGDGVNVAARLEGLAEPGGICIARNVYNQIKAKVAFGFEPIGEHKVKNIAEPITVFRVTANPGPVAKAIGLKRAVTSRRRWAAVAAAAVVLVATAGWYGGTSYLVGLAGEMLAPTTDLQEVATLPLPDKPSIAVLPFDNFSDEERHERLADGITEDIITDLSRFRELFVIARNSTFAYEDEPGDVREIAHELGVQYILEGSIQLDDDRVRVTAQLVDATNGNHLWSERYDRPADDVFAMQDEITQQIVGTLGGYWGRLAQAGRDVARRRPPKNLQAYDYYLLGAEHKHMFAEEDNKKARELLNKAIALDPQFARAYIVLAWTHEIDLFLGFSNDPDRSLAELEAAAQAAVRLDDQDAEAHLVLGVAHLYKGEIERGEAEFERALELGENNADVLAIASWTGPTRFGAKPEDIELVKRAMRLNPHHPDWYLHALGYAAYHAGHYDEAIGALRRAADQTLETRLYLALSFAERGRADKVAAEVAEVLELEPDFSAEWYASSNAFQDPAVITHFLDSIEKAGLPLCATEEQLAKYPDMKLPEQCEAERARS